MRRLLVSLAVSGVALATFSGGAAEDDVKLYGEPSKAIAKAVELLGHEGEVLDAVYLPDGTLMTAGADGTIRTWDVASGNELATVAKQPDAVTKLMFGPRRDQVLSFSESGAITVWQLPAPKRSWGPEQAIGPPNSARGDQSTAWASATPDDQAEWLLLEYEKPITAKTIRIHENFNPGAIARITAYEGDGKEEEAWRKPDAENDDADSGDKQSRELPLEVEFPIKRVKLHIHSPAVPGWNEIDAVGLIDADGKVHWASAAAASSTYAERRNGSSQPRFRVAPAPVYQIPNGATRLSHVDETAEGKQSYGGSGHAVEFRRPREAPYVVAIEVFGSRYGYPQPPDEDFEVYLLDDELKVVKRLAFPYAMFERGEERWVVLGVNGVEVPRRFHVALNFNAHQTKGVYVGKDENVEESHSLVGTIKSGFKPVDGKYDWMIRVHVAKERPAAPHELSLQAPPRSLAASRRQPPRLHPHRIR